MFVGQFNKFVVLDATSTSKNHTRSAIVGIEIIVNVTARNRPKKKRNKINYFSISIN